MASRDAAAGGFTARLIDILDRMVTTQGPDLDRVAAACVDALERGNLIHLFGSGHSVIPVLDAFPRYGSFVGLHPLTDPRLMFHNVLGPGGTRELQWLERTEGYIEKFLENRPLSDGDVLVCFSHGGTNAVPVDAARYARNLGVTTVAVTSMANADAPVRHSSGSRLSDVCEIVIDTCCPVEDAIVPVPGWARPTGGAATAIQIVVMQEIITRTAIAAATRGLELPTLASPTVAGVTLATNDEILAMHRRYVHAAEARVLRLPADR